jgi:hypothetical protein
LSYKNFVKKDVLLGEIPNLGKIVYFAVTSLGFSKSHFLSYSLPPQEKYCGHDKNEYITFMYFIVTMIMKHVYNSYGMMYLRWLKLQIHLIPTAKYEAGAPESR